MRTFARLRLGLASVAAASVAIVVTAAPAGAHEWDMTGLSTVKGCNSDVPVEFTVFQKHGKLKQVENFKAKDFNYPNLTPPIPVGKPTGNCLPGLPGWYHFSFRDRKGHRTTDIPFGTGHLKPNQFRAVYKLKAGSHVLFEDRVAGTVHVNKSKNGKFHVKAHGAFVEAISEGGLEFGGGSTGLVTWQAEDD